MSKPLSILAPTRYPWRFNSPRITPHKIHRRNFIPFDRISHAVEGITFLNPFPLRRFDLVHGFNRIPLGPTPYIIGFESHLPRAFGYDSSPPFKLYTKELAGDKCRRIIAISSYAQRQFLHQHKDSPYRPALERKLEVRYPNITIANESKQTQPLEAEPIRLLFVGNHFARKGGCVGLRIAELAAQRGLPVIVEIISSLEMGSPSWVDPLRPAFFDPDRALLASLPNVIAHGKLPNDATIALMRRAHFLLLPTFSDSFGYSAIESMANYTPVIATNQGALPEFIRDGENGIMLDIDLSPLGEWVHIGRTDRDTPAYEKVFRDEINRLAEETLEKILRAAGAPSYAAMRLAARHTAEALFDEPAASAYWNGLYEKVTV